MATLYNQYIYKNGAWMKIGTSSDSVTYTLSYSALTGLLTLIGSDGSTSTVTIESGSSDAITGITVNGTTVTVTDGVAAISIPTNVSAFTNDAGYITTPAFKITVTENNGTYTADKTYVEISQAINNGYICYVTDGTYNYYYTYAIEGYFYFEHSTSYTDSCFYISSDSVLYNSANQYGTTAQNMVLASPSDQSGAPYFRHLVATDIPDLSGTYLTSYTETDPVFSASAAAGITATDISNWNAKSSTDNKVAVYNGITDNAIYYPILSTNDPTPSTKLMSGVFRLNYESASTTLLLGSNGGKEGKVMFFSTTSEKYLTLATGTPTTSGTIYLPSGPGTLALTSDIPAQASINSTGLITYKNSGGTSLFTLQLPLYNGGVS